MIQKLKQLYDKATQGKWINVWDSYITCKETAEKIAQIAKGRIDNPNAAADTELIVALHNALPDLIKRIEEAEEILVNSFNSL